MLDYVIFNALVGNHDAHAKNFSLLYAGKYAVLAPLYDVLSTAVYPDLTPKMAMRIGGKYEFSKVQARHWDQFLEAVGLGKAQARKRILALAKSMPTTARGLQSDPSRGFTRHSVVEQIVTLIEQRSALTLRRLMIPSADSEGETEPSV
jgi:serine/threonine-protein kinase HipA